FHRRQRHRIKIVRGLGGQAHHRLLGRTTGNQRRGPGGVQKPLRREVVGVGVARALPRQHPHPASRRDALRGRLHHALVKRNRGGGLVFEIEVGEVAPGGESRGGI